MKCIHRFFISAFVIITFILLLFPYFKSVGYDYYIVDGNVGHKIAKNGTFVVFQKKIYDELKEFDIIKILYPDSKIARIISINKDENTFDIVYDDFDKIEKNIPISAYSGSLVFHLNEIGDLYNDYLKPYKIYFIITPFVCLMLGILSLILYIRIIDIENFEIEKEELLNEINDRIYDGESRTELITLKMNNLSYNPSILLHKPSFILKTGIMSINHKAGQTKV